MPERRNDGQPSRRGLLKGLSLLPVAAVATGSALAAEGSAPEAAEYKPTFFNADEWAFVLAACDRLIPKDDIGPGALELGVPEFLDRHMQTPYANGAIWYMQGPFLEAPSQFGYQGRLPPRDILRVGMKATDAYCIKTYSGRKFAALEHAEQEAVLKGLETSKIELEEIPTRYFFAHLLSETRMGYFADPKHGGNRGMGSWKMIGYPGMRADYTDWVEVRDRPYPIPPVDLSGKRA